MCLEPENELNNSDFDVTNFPGGVTRPDPYLELSKTQIDVLNCAAKQEAPTSAGVPSIGTLEAHYDATSGPIAISTQGLDQLFTLSSFTPSLTIPKKDIRKILLEKGFKLKPQEDGTQDLNGYVFDGVAEVIKYVLTNLKSNFSSVNIVD